MALTVLHDGAALDNFTKEGDYVVTNPAELLPGTYVVTINFCATGTACVSWQGKSRLLVDS